jgi:hypothetical protein
LNGSSAKKQVTVKPSDVRIRGFFGTLRQCLLHDH